MRPDPSPSAPNQAAPVPSVPQASIAEPGVSRREMLRLGAGLAGLVAGTAVVVRGGEAVAVASEGRVAAAAAAPGGIGSKVLQSGFRVTLDGHPLPNIVSLAIGPLETELDIMQSVATEVIYTGVVARLPILLTTLPGRTPDLETWYDDTRTSFGQPTRTIRIELITKQNAVVRTFTAEGCVLESFAPGRMETSGRGPPLDVYAAACPVTGGALALDYT